jgi:hypothetical protein
MFIIARAITYAALFIGLLLIYVPAQLLGGAGLARPQVIGPPQIIGTIIGTVGAAIALCCISLSPWPGKEHRRLSTHRGGS